MNTSKIIYRDISSNRLITPQEAVLREDSTWQEETFTPLEPSQEAPTGKGLPSVTTDESVHAEIHGA